MTVLEWDKVGERVYQTGVERGVLGLMDGTVVPWNGLTGVDDGNNAELKSYYLDGIKILDHVTPGDFVGKVKAITYPDEFEEVFGMNEVAPGFFLHEQPPKKFNLSYRTKIGDDTDPDAGYKLHFLYNLIAIGDDQSFQTIDNGLQPVEFAWSVTGTPEFIHNYRPTTHISLDSRRVDSTSLQELEDILYGTAETDPRFPAVSEVGFLMGLFGILEITDNGDGTWTADDPSDTYITMVDPTTFSIDHANVVYLDPDTYTIESTNL